MWRHATLLIFISFFSFTLLNVRIYFLLVPFSCLFVIILSFFLYQVPQCPFVNHLFLFSFFRVLIMFSFIFHLLIISFLFYSLIISFFLFHSPLLTLGSSLVITSSWQKIEAKWKSIPSFVFPRMVTVLNCLALWSIIFGSTQMYACGCVCVCARTGLCVCLCVLM